LWVPLTNRWKLVNYIYETNEFPRGAIKIIEIESGIAKGGKTHKKRQLNNKVYTALKMQQHQTRKTSFKAVRLKVRVSASANRTKDNWMSGLSSGLEFEFRDPIWLATPARMFFV